MVNVLPLDNPLGALEETPCTPLCLAFALSYQQCWAVKVFYKSICAITSQKQFESVKQQISDFDFELLIDIRNEASMSKVVQPG